MEKNKIIYPYYNENLKEEYRIVRSINENGNKNFKPYRLCNGKWISNMDGVRRVIYNLPNVMKADEIYWVEGEKDADNLNKLGLTATTTAFGANSFNKYKDYYSSPVKDKDVYIIHDNDKAGRDYANSVYKAIYDKARKVKILDLVNEIPDLKEKGDISDVLSEYGAEKTLKILERLKNKNYKIDIFPIQNIDELNEKTFEQILRYLGIEIKYNLITKRIVITGMPKKYAESDLYTILPIYLKCVLRNKGIKINDTKKIEEFIILEISKNNFNPILDLLESNKWDGIDRFEDICNIFNLSKELDKILLIKWIRQTVAMLLNNLNDSFGAEGILTLQGKQGIGKSRIMSLLSLNPEWVADGIVIDMNNKDSIIKATSRWICELGELDDTLKKGQSALKAFITSPEDDIRMPYAKNSTRRPRNTSFCASVNPISFLKDEENRRFWVIHVESLNYKKLEELGYKWILQLWLQAYNEVKKDINCFRLTDKEKSLLSESNLRYTEFIPYEEEFLNMIDFNSTDKIIWTNKEIISKLFPNATAQAIGRALNKIENYYPTAVKIGRTSKGVTYLMKVKDEFCKK